MTNNPLSRPGCKFLYELKDGEKAVVWENQIIIVHPERQPKIISNDGEIIDLFP